MSLDVTIRRNISFVGCVLIIAATESNIVHGPDMKPPPPPPLGIFEDSDFWTPCYMTIPYLLVCTQNIRA